MYIYTYLHYEYKIPIDKVNNFIQMQLDIIIISYAIYITHYAQPST